MNGSRKLNSSVRRISPIVTLVAATLAWALCLPSGVRAQGGFNGPGRYEIANSRSGQVLDLSQNDQASILQVVSTGTDDQRWEIRPADSGYYILRNAMSGMALQAIGGNTSVQAMRFTGDTSQQWRFNTGRNGSALIVSRLGNALETSNGRNSNGTTVRIYAVNGGSNQQFTFRQVSGSSEARWNDNSNGRWHDNPNDNSTTITCASTNGRRTDCNADTRGGVRMVRQLGSSTCIQGSTWDYDSRGIWVDHGCRADFAVSGGDNRGYDRSGQSRLTIEPNNNISWQSQGTTNARVYTQKDNGREQLFAEGRSGTQGAPWITQGHLYDFILRDVNGTELARNQIDLRPSSANYQRGYPGNSGSGFQPGTIGAGTTISVRTNEAIDARNNDGQVFGGDVDQDVTDSNGNIAIPRGSNVELVVKNLSNNELSLDLDSVTVNGQRYGITAGDTSVSGGRRDGIGTNQRTGEYVGGGALLGAIIGAIAGGGKGAAIGAGAGAAAGVGTQVLTRGRNVNVPAESLLTFRLEQPLQMGAADNGTTRDGRHYHDRIP